MKPSDFHFDLPQELIAQNPLPERDASRLLVLEGASGDVEHRHFRDLPSFLAPEDLLVFNNTRVIPARLWGRKATGGRVELLIERVLNDTEALAHVRSSKSPGAGMRIELTDTSGGEPVGAALQVLGREGALFHLRSAGDVSLASLLVQHGHMPLPPYIEREDETSDRERYQTVYARRDGAVAAPTAGLHFTRALLDRVDAMGVQRAEVTLHVGAGTFTPVRTDRIEDHLMHAEFVEVDAGVCQAVERTRERGGRVIAVGTTAVRALETAAAASGTVAPYCGDTRIFIYPGYRFACVDALVTNFHLPESTLIMLVSALAGREQVLAAYAEAVAERYRFFSYGDAMFVTSAQRGGSVR